MDDHRLGPLPGRDQTVEVLVVMERIAAAPIDEANVRIGQAPAVVVERRTGLEQHVGDARHGNEALDAVRALDRVNPETRRTGLPTALSAA